MNEILDELEVPKKRKLLDVSRTFWRLTFLFFIIALFTVYIASFFFGSNSMTTLWALEAQHDRLISEVEKLKEENAKHQQELFELKKLEGKN